jgi:hypothetical protein
MVNKTLASRTGLALAIIENERQAEEQKIAGRALREARQRRGIPIMTDSIPVEDLRHWRAHASTNDRMTYHVGLLMADRLANRVLNERATTPWWRDCRSTRTACFRA